MKPVRGRETLLLENGDAEGNVGIKSPPFRLWGKEKALTGFPIGAPRGGAVVGS